VRDFTPPPTPESPPRADSGEAGRLPPREPPPASADPTRYTVWSSGPATDGSRDRDSDS
jgi:hypothetical protein